MTNPFEEQPVQPLKPEAEAPSQEGLSQTEPHMLDALAMPEQAHAATQTSIRERVSVDDLTPEQAEQATEMLRPIQNPALNAARRQEAKDRQRLNPDQDGPVVPSTADEMAEYERRYDSGWQDPTPQQSPEEMAQKEGLENFRRAVELMDEFELAYPLQELHAITNISVAELMVHPVRKPANIALVHIRKALNALGSKAAPETEERYLRLSRAVGKYNTLSKSVEHD